MKSPSDPLADYAEELRKLDERPAPSTEALRTGVEGFKAFYANLDEHSVRDLTPKVYAPGVFFNDTLKTVRGSEALEEYFLETAKNTDRVQATVADVAIAGRDIYVRWEMEIEFAKFHRGKVNRSIGVTHLRVDEDGRIVLHQDYWDAAGGFFEHVPVVGAMIRFVKGML